VLKLRGCVSWLDLTSVAIYVSTSVVCTEKTLEFGTLNHRLRSRLRTLDIFIGCCRLSVLTWADVRHR